MWSNAKDWLVNHCWNAFSLDKWKKRSQTMAVLMGVAVVLSIVALLVAIWTQFSWQSWSAHGAVVLVPKERIVEINGASYIPIRIMG